MCGAGANGRAMRRRMIMAMACAFTYAYAYARVLDTESTIATLSDVNFKSIFDGIYRDR
jgi:hypothetical protein